MINLGPLTFERNGLKVIYDPILGHHRLDPYPDADETEAYYEGDSFYTNYSPADWFEKELAEYRAGLWNAYYTYLIRLADEMEFILDWGCGFGWFVDFCREANRFYWIEGLEPSLSAIDKGESVLGPLPIRSSRKELEVNTFDTIYLMLVLEHIVNPTKFLREIYDKISIGGQIVIVVPNDLNPLQTRLGYTGFISPVHVNYFTTDTLRHVMTEAGFTIIHESTTFPMELFPLLGINYFGNDALGRKCHRFRLRLEKLFGWRIFNLYKRLYDRWGIGRELIFVGAKR